MAISPPTQTAGAVPTFRIGFAGAPASSDTESTHLQLDVPWLGGARTESIFPDATAAGSAEGVQLFHSGSLLLGHAQVPYLSGNFSTAATAVYARILAVTRGLHLCRVWNYVPQINAIADGLERYRAFCQGRSLAFEREFGGSFKPLLPAASAVGSAGRNLDVIFAASEFAPRHFENPEQVPAYLYPPEHGPRPPSFARATAVRDGARTWTFVSGTAAIKGHQTIAPGSLDGQLDCTLDNLRLISRTSGLGANLGAERPTARHFKVYLRHASDLAAVQIRLESELLRADDHVNYLQAGICRAALMVEIEATLLATEA